MPNQVRLLILLLLLPVITFGQVTKFAGRFRVLTVTEVDDSTWTLAGNFYDLTNSYTGLDADTSDKIIIRDYDSLGRMVYDRYVVSGVLYQTVTTLSVNVRSDYSTGVLCEAGMPITGDFPIARPVDDSTKLTYRTSFHLNQIDPDYDAALDNLNLRSIDDIAETDPIYSADSGAIKDTLDAHNARINLKRNLSDHDSLSKLKEKNYESLTNKPSLKVTSDAPYSAIITIDSSDVILTADSGFSLVLVGNEIKVKNLKRTLASLDERSYNSLTDKPTDAITNYEATADSLTSCNITISGNPITGSCQVFLNNYPLTITTQWVYVATNKIKIKLPVYTYDKVQIAYRY